MRRLSCGFLFLIISFALSAQIPKLKDRKYQSLLWEITGNGLKKPSFLFGTMHVSSKMVFNLSDSFYTAIRAADVVALETNPESWQEDMFNFNFENDFSNSSYSWAQGVQHVPEEYININTLKFSKYEKLLEIALASNPSAINNLLYRTYSEQETDFEEDTYLDLYIYQAGKKWGKKVFGVEKYAESMKLAMEAYVDALKDKNKKEKAYDAEDEFSYSKLQEAYRTGNLDLLDTINRVNSFSPAFDEKFLYKRNDIQAASIDSILKSKMSLFVGVGAAHLPGQRGVIEILRRKGYKLRPVKMGERSSRYKNEIEKIKVPVTFSKQTSDDGFYKVDVPGKLYRFSNSFNGFDQQQFADMANGSYYVVTRIQTNASAWGNNNNDVARKVDSLLYENIPGKIVNKKIISKNGYKGFDIINKTRRGDLQRYNIFITPFEVLFFKISGTADYVTANSNADRFFNSIELKEYTAQSKKITPAFGGFEVNMPHEPYVIKNKNWQFLANDKINNIDFEVIRTDIHNYNFAEEDSFDLNLMEESFTASDFFDKSLSRRQTTFKGYPALNATYQYKDGSVAFVRYLIQGPHYYTLIAHAKKEQSGMMQFLNSFNFVPFVYKEPNELQTDTNLYFTVRTPYYPAKKNVIELPAGFESIYAGITGENEMADRPVYRDRVIANDSTGEKIHISFYKPTRYEIVEDSIDREEIDNKEDWIVKTRKTSELANGMKVLESIVTDSNSSRAIWAKTFSRNGVVYTIKTEIDTLTRSSEFVTAFFKSFQPSDTVSGTISSNRVSDIFFADFFSADTSMHKLAVKNIAAATFDSTDLPQLKKAISALNWTDKNYLEAKKDFFGQLGTISSQQTSLYLKDIFFAAGDTVDLQYSALENLLNQQTKYSFGVFRDIVANDPPILNLNTDSNDEDYDDESFLEILYDSLQLTSSIARDLLPLINIDDYEYPLIQLMATLVDSNLLSYKDYELYSSKFLLEAKQALKKQLIVEKNRAIEKAQKKINDNDDATTHNETSQDKTDYGNETLSLYATLLMPFWEKNIAVAPLLQQMLASNDKRLKYKTMLLFIRNGKQVPDSVVDFFAVNDDFRYDLYNDLIELKKPALFPQRYNNHLDLAISKLFSTSNFNKPDTISFMSQLPLKWANKEGLVYFFKYKRKKDDSWKIASVGLIQKDPNKFEFEKQKKDLYNDDLDFTEFSNVKFNEEEPLNEQLQKRLKQLLYAKRYSSKEFYKGDDDFEDSNNSLAR